MGGAPGAPLSILGPRRKRSKDAVTPGKQDKMNTTTIASLAEIRFEPTIRPIMDELMGLRRNLPCPKGHEDAHATFAATPFDITGAAARAVGFAEEVKRFLALAETSEPAEIAFGLSQLLALSALNAAATVAVALLPPRTTADISARARMGRDVLLAARDEDDARFVNAAKRAFAFDHADQPDRGAPLRLEPASVPDIDNVRHDEPAVAGLEQELSLIAWLRGQLVLGGLVEDAGNLIDRADGIARHIETYEVDAAELDQLERSRQGLLLLATADLARVVLFAGLVGDGRDLRRSALSVADELPSARLLAVIVFAALAGERLEELARSRCGASANAAAA